MFKRGDKLQKLLAVLITWALLLGFFFAYEQFYVKGQRDFLQEKEFRTLAALSTALEARVTQARYTIVSSIRLLGDKLLEDQHSAERNQGPQLVTVQLPKNCSERVPDHNAREDKRDILCAYLNLYLKDVWSATKSVERSGTTCWRLEDYVPLGLVPSDHRLALTVKCFNQVDDPDDPDPNRTKLIYTLDLQPWVRDSFEKLRGDFEDVLVADATGGVLYQQSGTGPRIANLNDIVPSPDTSQSKKGFTSTASSAPQEKTNKNNENNTSDQLGGPSDHNPDAQETSGFRKLAEASASTTITLEGESYQLFTQPTEIALTNYSSGKPWNLIVGGLRRTESLDRESHAIPYTMLIWLGLIAVALFSLSWPMFKLRLMSNTERFTPKDGWYLLLALFLASTSVLLMLLNWSYASQAQDEADSEMKLIAKSIKHNAKHELDHAFLELNRMGTDPDFPRLLEDSSAQKLYPNYFVSQSLGSLKAEVCYPYFQIAFWANHEGQQLLKFDVRPVTTPFTNVSSFPFFKDSVSDLSKGATFRGQPPCDSDILTPLADHLHLQPQYSPNTGEFSVILASPVADDRKVDESRSIAVQALATQPMSLVDSVLPPGYGFAVVDDECQVLFHSESIRNLRENFCQESKDRNELQPWLRSGVDTPLDISYTGRPERAYITSLPLAGLSNGQAFLVLFQEPNRQMTLNLAIILACSILLGTYFVILLTGAVVHLLVRGPLGWNYTPELVWPCRQNALIYLQLFGANTLVLLVFWLSYRWLYEAPLLFLTTLVVPVLSVGFVLLKLGFSSRTLSRPATDSIRASLLASATRKLSCWGRRLTKISLWALSFSLTLWLLSLLGQWLSDSPTSPPELLTELIIIFSSLVLFGQIAVLLSGEPSWLTRHVGRDFGSLNWLTELGRKHFTLSYSLAAASVITCVVLVPCLGFFKYAYDAVTELSLKHDELVLSERILERKNRIREYYDTVNAPDVAQKRIRQNWDRHDKIKGDDGKYFVTACEPALTPESCGQTTPPVNNWINKLITPVNDRIQQSMTNVNDSIEKWIAKGTLKFPANPLGSEMSKLGVASGENSDSYWEHTWEEADATHFKLLWRGNSRLPNLTLTSGYRDWDGLQGWALVIFLILWFLLVVWLVSLVRTIFFTHVESTPDFAVVRWESVQEIKTNYLVIGPAGSGKTRQLKDIADLPEGNFRDLRVELRNVFADPKYKIGACKGSVLVLDHFEFDLKDQNCNRARLELLEGLLFEPSCSLVVISAVDPLYFLTESADEILSNSKDREDARRLLDRWAGVLIKFTKVRLADFGEQEFRESIREFVGKNAQCQPLAALIEEECECTPFLRTKGLDILVQFHEKRDVTREWLVNTVLDRADTNYHVLWSGLTAAERLVLYELALDGWANPKNTTAIQQLEKKLLIRKQPMYRIINDSFQKFIESAEHADEIAQWEKYEQQSTWKAFRLVLIALASGTGVWLLHAQPDLFRVGVGYVAAVAALLAAVTGLIGRSTHSSPAEPSTTQQSS
jgi:hypothetical protein